MPLTQLNSLDSLSDITGKVSSAVSDAASSAASSAVNTVSTGVTGWFANYGGRLVMIVLGLLLIGAGVFSFDKTREIAVRAGELAA
jgi:predicted transporter